MSQFLACEMVRHPTLVTPALIIESNEIMMKSPLDPPPPRVDYYAKS